jgi:hypothetical protein
MILPRNTTTSALQPGPGDLYRLPPRLVGTECTEAVGVWSIKGPYIAPGLALKGFNRSARTASRRSAREVASDCTRTSAGPATVVSLCRLLCLSADCCYFQGITCFGEQEVFLKRDLLHRQCVCIYTVCTRINYTIVPVTNSNKYLQYGTSGTEYYVYRYRCK